MHQPLGGFDSVGMILSHASDRSASALHAVMLPHLQALLQRVVRGRQCQQRSSVNAVQADSVEAVRFVSAASGEATAAALRCTHRCAARPLWCAPCLKERTFDRAAHETFGKWWCSSVTWVGVTCNSSITRISIDSFCSCADLDANANGSPAIGSLLASVDQNVDDLEVRRFLRCKITVHRTTK